MNEREEKVTGTEVAPADLLEEMMRAHAGEGVSTDASDNLVPGIRVLQPLSPAVTSGRAAAGDFALADRVIKGTEGLWFQVCWQDNIWLEFNPRERGGGYVAAHPFSGYDQSGDAVPPPGSRRSGQYGHVMAASGNDVAHYAQWSGFMWESPGRGLEHVINFAKSGHTTRRKWNTKMLQANRYPDGRSRPIFGHVYHLTTYQTRNSKGTWYLVDVGPPVMLGTPEAADVVGDSLLALQMAIEMRRAFECKEKVASVDVAQADADDDDAM